MSVILNTCGASELDFWQLLAGALMTDGTNVGFSFVDHSVDCSGLTPVIDCDNKDQDPKEIVKQAFAIDDCGHIVIHRFIPTT